MIGILGGGLAGLATGSILRSRGIEFRVIEKEEECGGLLRSLYEDGFTFDYGGSHIIFSKNNEALNFFFDLLGDNILKIRRNTKILFKGLYIKYPFENGLNQLSREDNYDCLLSFILNFINSEKDNSLRPTNLKEWCYYNFGEGIANKYLIPYNEKIWKHRLDDIGLEWVERIPNPPLADIIKSSLGFDTEGYKHQLYFFYPKYGGIQYLTKQLEERIGDNIQKNFEILNIEQSNKKWIVQSDKRIAKYDKLISTMPIQSLIKAIDSPKEIRLAANNLKYNSIITIMIGVDISSVNNYSWLYIPDTCILPHRISFPSNFSQYVAPFGKSSILAEITCRENDNIWKTSDEDLIERTVNDLDKIGILDKEKVCYANIRRLKYAYVINDLSYKKNLYLLRSYLSSIGIDCLGRFSEYEYINMDECIIRVLNYFKNYKKCSPHVEEQ